MPCSASTVRASEKSKLWRIGSRSLAFQRAIDEVRMLPLSLPVARYFQSGFIPIRQVAEPSVNNCTVKARYRNENFDP